LLLDKTLLDSWKAAGKKTVPCPGDQQADEI